MFRTRRKRLALIVIAAMVTGAIVVAAERSSFSESSAHLPAGAVVSPTPTPSAAQTPMPSVTPDAASLADDVGAVLVVSQRGTAMSPTLRSLLLDGHVGGVLLFASNFKTQAGLRAWTDQLRALESAACLQHPILVMVDEEGGRVNQVQAPFAAPSYLNAAAAAPAHSTSV